MLPTSGVCVASTPASSATDNFVLQCGEFREAELRLDGLHRCLAFQRENAVARAAHGGFRALLQQITDLCIYLSLAAASATGS